MAEEIEVKCKVEDLGAFRRVLARTGARPVGRPTQGGPRGREVVRGRVHEMNEVFDSAQGTFASRDQLVRVRVERWGRKGRKDRDGQRVVLTFKDRALRGGAEAAVLAGPHKIREEVEVEVAEAEAIRRILTGMGLRRWFRYEKYRTTYRLPEKLRWAKGLLIELDETPTGNYVELEGPAEAIDRAATLLGFNPRDYITKSYLQIYLEDCRRRGVTPGDMLFGQRDRKKLL